MKKLFPIIVIAVLGVAFTATSYESEAISATSVPDSCYMGDVDLDGISSSIADVVLFASYFRCGLSVFTVAPMDWQISQTDFNCDGLVLSVADLVTVTRVLSGEIEPCYCWAGSTIVLNDPPLVRTSTEPYSISIADQSGSGYGMDTVEILLSGVNELLGYQLHLEYDTAGIALADVQRANLFSDWEVFTYTDKIIGLTAQLRITSSSNYNPTVPPNLQPPLEPTAIIRLIFNLTSDSALVRNIRFVWDDCGDNGIAVNDTTSWCSSPEYLAVSRDVFDVDGSIITGTPGIYGGAGDICLAGSQFGGGTLPQRLIDFHNGQMTYTPACCVGVRGDINGDGTDSDVADLTCLVGYLFTGSCDIGCPEEVDVNGDGSVDVADLTYLVSFMFYGESPPVSCN